MAVGQDYQCINIKAAQYNRERKQRAEEARVIAESRAAESRRSAAVQAQNTARRPAAGTTKTNTAARSVKMRGAAVPAASAGHTAAGAVRTGSYGFGNLLTELLVTVVGYAYTKHRENAAARAAEPEYRRVRVGTHRSVPIAFVGYLAVFAVIAGMLLVGNARVSSAKSYNNTVKNEIAAARSEGKALDEKLERGMDAAYVEAYAVEELGMVKKSEVTRRYITYGGEEKIVSSSAAS